MATVTIKIARKKHTNHRISFMIIFLVILIFLRRLSESSAMYIVTPINAAAKITEKYITIATEYFFKNKSVAKFDNIKTHPATTPEITPTIIF